MQLPANQYWLKIGLTFLIEMIWEQVWFVIRTRLLSIYLHTHKKTTKHARNATRRKQNKNSINIFWPGLYPSPFSFQRDQMLWKACKGWRVNLHRSAWKQISYLARYLFQVIVSFRFGFDWHILFWQLSFPSNSNMIKHKTRPYLPVQHSELVKWSWS